MALATCPHVSVLFLSSKKLFCQPCARLWPIASGNDEEGQNRDDEEFSERQSHPLQHGLALARVPPKNLASSESGGHTLQVLTESRCVIGLGANLGDRVAAFESTVTLLARVGCIQGISNLYETAAIGGPAQPDYSNAAVLLSTGLSPKALLEEMLSIELRHGRVRTVRWGPRQLDLDLLWIEGVRVDEPGLKVPHPRLTERGFALLPLLDVAPDAREPSTDRAYAGMRKNVREQAIHVHGFARPWTDDWLAESPSGRLWQIADLGL